MPQTESVILVDLDPGHRGHLRAQLDALGFTCFPGDSAQEALDLAKRLQPGLVILDVMLPDLGAYRACAEIRRLPGCGAIAIVLAAPREQPRVRLAAARAGADAVLIKPFSANDVLIVADPILDKAESPAFGPARHPAPAWPTGMAEPPGKAWAPRQWTGRDDIPDPELAQGRQMLAVIRRLESGRKR